MLEQETLVAEQWMPALQELARRTSHEVRNALNGVSVNLEVIRSRLERAAESGDEVAASVVPFARSAAEQLDQLAGITEAFLSLSRSAASGSADMLPLVTRATSLARYIARSEGRGVTFTASGDGEVFTSTSCEVARLVVVRLLLDALSAGANIDVRLGPGPRLYVSKSGNDGSPGALDSGLVAAAATVGVLVVQETAGWRVDFPTAGPRQS